jgi:hypothetical protein
MSRVSAFRHAVAGAALVLVLASGCARWQPVRVYEVTSAGPSHARYDAVVEVAKNENYTVVWRDDAGHRLRLEAKTTPKGKSFIDVEVNGVLVKLSPAGNLVRGDMVHKALNSEIARFDEEVRARLDGASAMSASATSAPIVNAETP